MRSSKKDDPLKVGRFGIGFNSVYHMTGKCNHFDIQTYEFVSLRPIILKIAAPLLAPFVTRLWQENASFTVRCLAITAGMMLKCLKGDKINFSFPSMFQFHQISVFLKQMMIGCFMPSVPSFWMGSLCQKY